jgi:hypothetical protein
MCLPSRRLPAFLVVLLLIACGGGSNSAGGYGGRSLSLTPTRTAGSERGILTLSGAVSGDMSLDSVICPPRGATIIVSLAGRVGDTQYGVQINSVDTGGFDFGTPKPPDKAALVLLSDQTVTKGAVPRWSAGFPDSPGKGKLALAGDHSGQIDADLEGSEGTKGGVHVRGQWKCPTGATPIPDSPVPPTIAP